VTYSANYEELWRDTTGLPRENLERRPAGLPDELTTKLALVIKLKKAKTLRLTIPLSIVALADEEIE
jgi:ABC-type uncharacterized transport system substrate-binding protein